MLQAAILEEKQVAVCVEGYRRERKDSVQIIVPPGICVLLVNVCKKFRTDWYCTFVSLVVAMVMVNANKIF